MKKFAVTLLILVLLAAAVLAGATIVYAGTDEYKKPSPRETRGFSHAGIALAPRGTRATRNAV